MDIEPYVGPTHRMAQAFCLMFRLEEAKNGPLHPIIIAGSTTAFLEYALKEVDAESRVKVAAVIRDFLEAYK